MGPIQPSTILRPPEQQMIASTDGNVNQIALVALAIIVTIVVMMNHPANAQNGQERILMATNVVVLISSLTAALFLTTLSNI